MPAGDRDLQRAAERLAARLPAQLAGLARLAYNYHWSWQPGGADVFRRMDPARWRRVAGNPVRLLQEAAPESIAAAAADAEIVGRIERSLAGLEAELARPPAPGLPVSTERPAVFLCAEYAIHGSLPIYSGGLGALAGDFLKQASDDALPLVAVGLLYRQGFFRQHVDAAGRQTEYWVDSDPERLPAALVTNDDGDALTISVPIADQRVHAQIWRVDVGRVALYLLDSDRPENSPISRWIGARLYISDPDVRLAQYLLLGVGGVRALEAMGIDPGQVHLNEGHPAFASLELARREIAGGAAPAEAIERARRRVTFTTHTPVPAGNDTYPVRQLSRIAGAYADESGIGVDGLVRLGRPPSRRSGPFGLTEFALHTSARANAVSARHGAVARAMWHSLWPGLEEDAVPIGHVTNGVHEPTWLGGPMRALLDRHLPDGWLDRSADPREWDAVERIAPAELWRARREQRAALVAAVQARSVTERLGRGDRADFARAASENFDADTLTVGFARRIATYKRLGLLVADIEATRALLRGPHRIQIVLAGKAHPSDEDGKRLLQELFELKPSPEVAGRVVYLEDYDLATAALLVQGADVWLNLPRPPLEASGTSGMKAAVNGGLHLSVLDGWWAEAYDGTNGWALPGEVLDDEQAQDARDGAELLQLLTEDVVPLFYERDGDGIPRGWLERVRASLRSIGPAFSAQRMLRDYLELGYRR